MCGVVAILAPRGRAEGAQLAGALDALAHRGPDGRGTWTSPDGHVALGHVRLAVRDVDGGAQPIANEEGSVVAAVNGELYATAQLRSELLARGHRFRARTDSELLVHAWEEWGPALLSRLRGEYAFVLWDTRDRILFAARDPFGTKPLAWAEHDGRILVASQVRALFALGLPARWDHGALFQSASLQYAPPDSTLFDGARQLQAGHALLVGDGRARVFTHADIDSPRAAAVEPASHAGEDEHAAIRELASRFDDAVRVRLEADVPYAFQLSGGIDSSAVLASAAAQVGRPLDAFTVSFTEGGAYDEVNRAAAIARHVGARHHVVRVSDRDVADSFASAVAYAEGPCINAHAAAKLRLSAAIRGAGFKVALTGEGADEVLFGYAHFRGDLDGESAALARSNAASAGLMLPDGDGISLAAIAGVLGFVPTWLQAKAGFGKRLRALTNDAWLARFDGRDAARVALQSFDVSGKLEGRGRVEQSAYLWSKLALEGYILRALGDGLEMANGVEGRLPFLDSNLFAFVRALPTSLKIREGVEKWAFRRAMAPRLPPDVVAREKHPFLAPPMGPATLAAARDVLASQAFRAQPVFDSRKVQSLLDELPAMPSERRKSYDPVLFYLFSIAILQTRFGIAS